MSDRSGMQTCEASAFAQEENAELSRPMPAAAGDSHVLGLAPPSPKKASLDHSSLVRRIHDNLNWAYMFDHRTSSIPPVDLWGEIKALLAKPNKEFVTRLYEVLLGRPPEPLGVTLMCALPGGRRVPSRLGADHSIERRSHGLPTRPVLVASPRRCGGRRPLGESAIAVG